MANSQLLKAALGRYPESPEIILMNTSWVRSLDWWYRPVFL